ncbi:hypothetical protein RhiJN_19927 [Ceratobasidium sp. AG-Ba]|nr:hypothetical protein RhiJN_19927 [Ceratobasidium sp. AG-Ba]
MGTCPKSWSSGAAAQTTAGSEDMWKFPLTRYKSTDQRSNFPTAGQNSNSWLSMEHLEASKPVIKLPVDDAVTLRLFQLDGTYKDAKHAISLDKD